ncbi:MAG: hypothetical protein HY674_15640 [Chloroflexi bacterium]|nr:hypothetical protein [Chloroflexota bacterium]
MLAGVIQQPGRRAAGDAAVKEGDADLQLEPLAVRFHPLLERKENLGHPSVGAALLERVAVEVK